MIRYTKEQKDFLINNNYMRPAKELAKMFNKQFGTNITASNIKTFRGNHKLNSGLTGRFEKGNIPINKGTKGMFNVGGNRTSFKKGNIPQNHKPVGYERINVDGYIEIKTKEPNVFKLKHRVVYEEANGPIPKDYNVVFADGNKLNLDLNNLILVSKAEMLIMNQQGLFLKNKELTKTGVAIAKVIDKTNKLRKK